MVSPSVRVFFSSINSASPFSAGQSDSTALSVSGIPILFFGRSLYTSHHFPFNGFGKRRKKNPKWIDKTLDSQANTKRTSNFHTHTLPVALLSCCCCGHRLREKSITTDFALALRVVAFVLYGIVPVVPVSKRLPFLCCYANLHSGCSFSATIFPFSRC